MTQTSQTKIQLRHELERLRREQKKVEERLHQIQKMLKKMPAKKAGFLKARRGSRNKSGFDAAVQAGDVRLVREQIQSGRDPNWHNSVGEPVLLLAVNRTDNEQVVHELLDAGARVDERDRSGNTPLISCVRDPDLATVQLLVERGADLNAANKQGDTPLTNAACWGSARVVKYLLDHGADPLLRDGEAVLPSGIAMQQGHEETAKLIERFVAMGK